MPEWATVSIRRELIEEIRSLLEKTRRYRSVSEFVSESIRLRLEELSKSSIRRQQASSIPFIRASMTQPATERMRKADEI